LYHNNGDGTFTKITQGDVVSSAMTSWGASWVDYDNDGFLDLFVSNFDPSSSGVLSKNVIYNNKVDATFERLTTGSPAKNAGSCFQCSWADYDNDGFPDLVANSSGGTLLYRNNGNSNSWVKVQCRGVLSNRAAIGAKVRVNASYRGASRWQLREITSGDGWS